MQNKDEQINELTLHNEELENYFRNTIIPQIFIDANLRLRKFTPPAMKQFKLKHDDIGKHVEDLQENFRFPTIIDNIKQVISNAEILEKEVQTLDLNWYQMNIIPYLMRRENKTNGVIITFVDITSRIKDLKEQEKLIAEHELLLDTIAHDIKTPLTSLSMTIQMLKRLPEKGMDRFPELLEHVESSLVKMKTIVYDLVQSRWSEHRYQALLERLDLQNILEDVRLALAPQILESKVEISYEIGISEINFVRRKLRSVIYNLLNNAIKYRSLDRPLKIKIVSSKIDNFMVITISDNGLGIDAKQHKSVFEKYQRVDSSSEGNGVGLYLVKEVVESTGGKIELESSFGEGSAFRVFLPLDF